MINSKSRILFITHHFLHGTGGGCYASRAYINAFATLFNNVTLLYPYKKGMVAEHIIESVKKIPVTYEKSVFLKLLDLLCGRVHRYQNIENKIDLDKFDIVVFDTSIVTYGIIDQFKNKGCRTIVIHHNYQYEYFRDNTYFPLNIPTLFWCKKFEKEAVLKADLNLTLTHQDEHLLQNNYAKNTGNISFEKIGVFEYEPRALNYVQQSNSDQLTFIITGTLGSYQTYESLFHWFHKYYHLFREIFPNAQLVVAGRNPSKKMVEMLEANDNVKVIPNPTTMDDVIQYAQVYICPTELGGGLKLRIMDGLSHGLPVITHKVSARGYDDFLKLGYVQSYFDIDSFCKCLKTVKSTQYDSNEIIKSYEQIFSFHAGVSRLSNILSRYFDYKKDE